MARAQIQGHHSIDRPEERGVERGSASRSSLKGRERVVVSQTNITEPYKRRRFGNFWETDRQTDRGGERERETGWSAYGLLPAHRYHPELNWTGDSSNGLTRLRQVQQTHQRRYCQVRGSEKLLSSLLTFILLVLVDFGLNRLTLLGNPTADPSAALLPSPWKCCCR